MWYSYHLMVSVLWTSQQEGSLFTPGNLDSSAHEIGRHPTKKRMELKYN